MTEQREKAAAEPPLDCRVMRPGAGWRHIAGAVYEHTNGTRVHLLGMWDRAPFYECANCGLRTDRPMRAQCLGPDRSQHAWKSARRRVFCASLSDVFDNEVPAQWRRDLFDLILATPHLDWMLLTKRIGNVRKMLDEVAVCRGALLTANDEYRPPANIWIGATICNQEEADRDIPKLLQVPAAVRFLSIEPMLGPIDLGLMGYSDSRERDGTGTVFTTRRRSLDWVIVGGESGPQARPMHPDWARSLRDQCAEAGVPFLFKQWGEWIGADQEQCPVGPPENRWMWSDGTPFSYKGREGGKLPLLCRAGKKAAGRLLDGAQHDGYPKGGAE